MPDRMLESDAAMSPVRPLRAALVVLAVVFVSEGLVMLLIQHLPSVLLEMPLASLFDAAVVSLAAALALWWTVVRPSRRMFQARGRLLQNLFRLQEDERARIARDLHDQVGQSLTAVMIGLRTMENVATLEQATQMARRLRESAATALDETRRLARGLSPQILADLGLGPAVERLCEELAQLSGIRIEVLLGTGLDGPRPPEVELAAYRAIQEVLTNVVKHSRATHATVNVRHEGGHLRATVRDDGCGISPQVLDSIDRAGGSFGLAGVHERVRLLGGRVRVQSSAGAGTAVDLTLPIAN